MNKINHKEWCLPIDRKTTAIAPVVGLKCSNCGGESKKNKHPFDDGYESYYAHLRHYQCPYKNKASKEFFAWHKGFEFAYKEANE